MGYHRAMYALGADETVGSPVLQQQIDKIDARTDDIVRRLEAEKRARKIATVVTIAGALFAAVRLGVVTLPKLFGRSSGQGAPLGQLAPSVNPRGRRRRRR